MFPLNLPNALTVLRILLVPVVVVALLDETPNGDAIAAAVFALAALTDGLDGWIARSRGSITTFGKLMDPLADKLLVTAALVSLVSLGRLEAWIAMVIIAREFAISSLRSFAASDNVVIPAGWSGKVKTVVQVVAISLLIIYERLGELSHLAPLALWLAVIVSVLSGIEYFVRFGRLIWRGEAPSLT
jgi:CDP-diacylglycerol--glycerol-3-phosphate 3-phosphatidyltransferase